MSVKEIRYLKEGIQIKFKSPELRTGRLDFISYEELRKLPIIKNGNARLPSDELEVVPLRNSEFSLAFIVREYKIERSNIEELSGPFLFMPNVEAGFQFYGIMDYAVHFKSHAVTSR